MIEHVSDGIFDLAAAFDLMNDSEVSARVVSLLKASQGVSTYAIEFVEKDAAANFWGISFPSNT